MLNKHTANNGTSCAMCNAEMITPFAVDETGVPEVCRCAYEKQALPHKKKGKKEKHLVMQRKPLLLRCGAVFISNKWESNASFLSNAVFFVLWLWEMIKALAHLIMIKHV